MNHMIRVTGILLLLLTIFGISNAEEARPERYGKVQEINLLDSWVLIGSRRLQVTPETQIRNFETPTGIYLRAIKIGQPVFFSATREHQLLKLWIYPRDIRKRAQLLDENTLERMY